MYPEHSPSQKPPLQGKAFAGTLPPLVGGVFSHLVSFQPPVCLTEVGETVVSSGQGLKETDREQCSQGRTPGLQGYVIAGTPAEERMGKKCWK